MTESEADRFREIDQLEMNVLGPKKVDQIMSDLRDLKLSLKQVSLRNRVTIGIVCQVARFHKIDPVTLEPIE